MSASIRFWLLVCLGIGAVLAANAHLLYLAILSQPACVAHLGPGEGGPDRATFSAAQSSCSPPK